MLIGKELQLSIPNIILSRAQKTIPVEMRKNKYADFFLWVLIDVYLIQTTFGQNDTFKFCQNGFSFDDCTTSYEQLNNDGFLYNCYSTNLSCFCFEGDSWCSSSSD